MKKRIITLVFMLMLVISLTGCSSKVTEDSKKFKKDYEALNDKDNGRGGKYRTVSIPEANPFVYATVDDIVLKLENKESFYVYFGDEMCPWCRSVIEKAIEIAKENKVKKIYYVEIWDKDHNEIVRDKYELSENKEVLKVSDGHKDYEKLLEYFNNVLDDYILERTEDSTIGPAEKRIYAPNFIKVEKGSAIKMVEGISSKQEDANAKLTDEMLNDEVEQFQSIFKK
jgi:thiol-disulfide isomerase/thioredoxin